MDPGANPMDAPFRYARRVQFGETDLAGIVHFSWMFRYMEEAEHAAWRAAGLSIAEKHSDLGWPRVAASFDFRSPLHFEDEFEVIVRLAEVGTRSLQYEHTIKKGDVLIGTGRIKTVCTRTSADGSMRAIEIPAEIVQRLRSVLNVAPAVSTSAPDLPV
jgi:YbgC/YbaW family acyl-CoA thioester hydrolase